MSHIIPKSVLEKWARQKFCERSSTLDLMTSVEDAVDKVAIAIVALLEVKPEFRYAGMRADEVKYIKSCHAYLTRLRKQWGC